MNKLLCVADIAKALGASEQTVCRMMARGDIPAVKIGRRWYVSEARFDEFLEVGSNDNNRR